MKQSIVLNLYCYLITNPDLDVTELMEDAMEVYSIDIMKLGYNINQHYDELDDYSECEYRRRDLSYLCLLIRATIRTSGYFSFEHVRGHLYRIFY